MKTVISSLVIGYISLFAFESSAQVAVSKDKTKTDTLLAEQKSAYSPPIIHNDLPLMPKKKEPANKLLLEEKRVLKKSAIKRKYKREKTGGIRASNRHNNKHGIMAERKKKDKMFR